MLLRVHVVSQPCHGHNLCACELLLWLLLLLLLLHSAGHVQGSP
jgi:hypothetical protein